MFNSCKHLTLCHVCLGPYGTNTFFQKDTNLLLGSMVRREDHRWESYQMRGHGENQQGPGEVIQKQQSGIPEQPSQINLISPVTSPFCKMKILVFPVEHLLQLFHENRDFKLRRI